MTRDSACEIFRTIWRARRRSCMVSTGGWIEMYIPTSGSGAVAVIRGQGLGPWFFMTAFASSPHSKRHNNCKSCCWWEQKLVLPKGPPGRMLKVRVRKWFPLWLLSYVSYLPPFNCRIRWAKTNVYLLGWEAGGAQKKHLKTQTSSVLGRSVLAPRGGIWPLGYVSQDLQCEFANEPQIRVWSWTNRYGNEVLQSQLTSKAEDCKCCLLPMSRNQCQSVTMIMGGKTKTLPQLDWVLSVSISLPVSWRTRATWFPLKAKPLKSSQNHNWYQSWRSILFSWASICWLSLAQAVGVSESTSAHALCISPSQMPDRTPFLWAHKRHHLLSDQFFPLFWPCGVLTEADHGTIHHVEPTDRISMGPFSPCFLLWRGQIMTIKGKNGIFSEELSSDWLSADS